MPKLKTREDKLKELLLGRKAILQETNESIGKKCGMKMPKVRYFFSKGSNEWKVGELLSICQCLNVPIDELRGAIRY